MSTPLELIERIEKLKEDQAKLLVRLKRSLAIKDLWPEVKFPATISIQTDSTKPRFMWMIFKDSNDNTKAVQLADLPDVLLESEALIQFMKFDPRVRKFFARMKYNKKLHMVRGHTAAEAAVTEGPGKSVTGSLKR